MRGTRDDAPHPDRIWIMTEERVDVIPQSVEDEVVMATVVEETVDLVPDLELSTDPDQAISLLVSELAAARAAANDALDKWKRAVAEFDNYRKRSLRDQAEMIARSSERVLVRLLPVLDSLDAAIVVETVASSEAGMRQGLSGTRDLLLSTLAREGMNPIEALGAVFDPTLHEAAQIGEGSGTMVVAAELRRGYTLNGRVIRAALVVVGYETVDTQETAGEDQGSA